MTDRELLALMAAILQTAKPGSEEAGTVRMARGLLREVEKQMPASQDRGAAFGTRTFGGLRV